MARGRSELRATAYHEAGHAVVRIRLGLSVRRATIKPRRGWLGHVSSAPWPVGGQDQASIGLLVNEAVATLAGPVTEKRITGRWNHVGAGRGARVGPASLVVGGSDLDRVSDVVLAIAGLDDREQLHLSRWLHRRAENYVSGNWAAIERVAAALLAEQTLSRGQIVAAAWPAVADLQGLAPP